MTLPWAPRRAAALAGATGAARLMSAEAEAGVAAAAEVGVAAATMTGATEKQERGRRRGPISLAAHAALERHVELKPARSRSVVVVP